MRVSMTDALPIFLATGIGVTGFEAEKSKHN